MRAGRTPTAGPLGETAPADGQWWRDGNKSRWLRALLTCDLEVGDIEPDEAALCGVEWLVIADGDRVRAVAIVDRASN